MALKPDQIKAGLSRGIAAERTKALEKFARADAVLGDRPLGLMQPRVAAPISEPSSAAPLRWEEGDRVLSVSLALVDDNPFNARRIYREDHINELATSIAANGQQVPVKAVRSTEQPGRYVLIDGHYRKQACRRAGKSDIKILLESSLLPEDLYRLSYVLNHERSPQCALDNALAWQQLLLTGVYSKAEAIAEATGQSVANISKTLAMMNLPASVIDRMRDAPDQFGLAVAYELTLLHKAAGEESTLAIVERVVTEGLSKREVEAIRKAIESPKRRKPKETSRQYKLRSEEGTQYGVLKEWDNGRVVLELRIRDAEVRTQLIDEMKRRFKVD